MRKSLVDMFLTLVAFAISIRLRIPIAIPNMSVNLQFLRRIRGILCYSASTAIYGEIGDPR
jgi:hypothetical protein